MTSQKKRVRAQDCLIRSFLRTLCALRSDALRVSSTSSAGVCTTFRRPVFLNLPNSSSSIALVKGSANWRQVGTQCRCKSFSCTACRTASMSKDTCLSVASCPEPFTWSNKLLASLTRCPFTRSSVRQVAGTSSLPKRSASKSFKL